MPPVRTSDPGTRALCWFTVALLATLTLLHSGFDTTEGSDHAATAFEWIETGRLGRAHKPADIFVRGGDGLYYTAHELGAVLWHLPSAALALVAEAAVGVDRVPGVSSRAAATAASFASILVSAATALGFWKWLEWRFAAPLALRAGASVLLVFATMLLPYSRMLSDVGPTGAWLTWGAALGARAAATGRAWPAVAAGFALGFALLTRLPSMVAVVPLFLVLMANTPRSGRRRMAALALAGAAPCVAGVLWFNDVRTGSPFMPAFLLPQFHDVRPGTGGLARGVAGLLASPGKSLFVFSPILLLSLAGWRRVYRAAPVDALGIAGACASFLLVHGTLGSWHADWGWGPRHFVFMVPLAWLPGALLLGALPSPGAARRAAIVLVALSVCVQAAAMTVNWHYQYQLMWADGRLRGDTPWRADNQMTDMVRAAGASVARTLGADVPARAPLAGVSPLLHATSTRINVWWITALGAGISPRVVWPIVLALAGMAALAWRRTLRAVGERGVQ